MDGNGRAGGASRAGAGQVRAQLSLGLRADTTGATHHLNVDFFCILMYRQVWNMCANINIVEPPAWSIWNLLEPIIEVF